MRFEDENNEDNWMPPMMISIDIPTVNKYINDHPCNEQVSYYRRIRDVTGCKIHHITTQLRA